ncbi:MAG: hypothetical protein MUP11_09795, partial [Anaerolineales bacterium]|nr:hypothetical protein [Anaerolineales bacterium]
LTCRELPRTCPCSSTVVLPRLSSCREFQFQNLCHPLFQIPQNVIKICQDQPVKQQEAHIKTRVLNQPFVIVLNSPNLSCLPWFSALRIPTPFSNILFVNFV